MVEFKRYMIRLLGFDMLITAIYIIICIVTSNHSDVNLTIFGAIIEHFDVLFTILISTVLICIGLYAVNEA